MEIKSVCHKLACEEVPCGLTRRRGRSDVPGASIITDYALGPERDGKDSNLFPNYVVVRKWAEKLALVAPVKKVQLPPSSFHASKCLSIKRSSGTEDLAQPKLLNNAGSVALLVSLSYALSQNLATINKGMSKWNYFIIFEV